MSTILIDTHDAYRILTKCGFSEEQAEGITSAIQSIDLGNLATKQDLRHENKNLEVRLVKFMFVQALATAALVVSLMTFFQR